METISMHCKSISQIQSGAHSGLKVISLVEQSIQRRSADSSLVAIQQKRVSY